MPRIRVVISDQAVSFGPSANTELSGVRLVTSPSASDAMGVQWLAFPHIVQRQSETSPTRDVIS